MDMNLRLLVGCVISAALVACGHAQRRHAQTAADTAAAGQRRPARPVNASAPTQPKPLAFSWPSRPYDLEAGPGMASNAFNPESLYPVLVRHADSTRVIPDLFVGDSLALTLRSDSLVFAAAFDSTARDIGVLRFDQRSGRLDTLPFPPGFSLNLTSMATSPGGRFVAYIEFDSTGDAFGVVRRWADRSLVFRTPRVIPPGETDAQVGGARWIDSTHFELGIATNGEREQWVRYRGVVGSARFVQDTVSAVEDSAGPGTDPR